MAWEDEQENSIKEFTRGDTQLIVTTSVLQGSTYLVSVILQ